MRGKKHMRKKFNLKKALLLLCFLYACYSIISQQIIISKIHKQTATAKQELSKLKEKNERLQDDVKMSKTDAYIEKLAREILNYIKPEETPVKDKK